MKKPDDLDALVDGIRSADDIRREAAIARLRVIGVRALPRLLTLLRSDSSPATRCAVLSALEGLEDRRALDAALPALDAEAAEVAIAATRVLRGWVTQDTETRVLDALSALALDESRDTAVRAAAVDALSDLPRDLVRPILEQGPLPSPSSADDPDTLRDWLLSAGAGAPLSALHDAIVRARERQQGEPSGAVRREWEAVRGIAHAALARRGSRVALYDLREAFAAATSPLPLDYLSAMAAIGDASCLEPLARAWAAAPGETWWRERLSSTAEGIVHGARLSGRSAVLKRVRAKWAGFV